MDPVLANALITRRRILGGLATAGTGLFVVGCANGNGDRSASGRREDQPGEPEPRQPAEAPARTPARGPDVDAKIMTFALNLEYMEAEYYTRGAHGHSLKEHGTDVGRSPGEVRGGRKVNFSNSAFQQYAEELAFNEAAHVEFYRKTLGSSAVDCPAIDFEGAFAAVAQAAGLAGRGETFDPFADEISFFLGGMLFEDVGVTAYHGAAPLITSKETLDAATGILAVEAYHMGMVRTLLHQSGPRGIEAANKVSDARDALDGPNDLDQGIEVDGKANIVPSDRRAIAYSRTPRQVLNIVYLKQNAPRGGFYPNGMNGDFTGLV